MNFNELIVLFWVVFGFSVVGTGCMRHIAKRMGWLALPRQDRWHKKPVALYGGLGFFPAFFLGATFIIIKNEAIRSNIWVNIKLLPQDSLLALALLFGSLLMFLIGLVDDFKDLHPATKLMGQFVAASLFIFAGGFFSITGIRLIDFLFTYIWFVGITNATNMLDNMDGLSSGVTIVSVFILILLMLNIKSGFAAPNMLAFPLGVAFSAALCGFWIYNRPPASIFMGDSGSLFMGFALAGLALPSSLNDFFVSGARGAFLGPLFAFLIPVTVLSVPIFDTTLVTLSRLWRGQSPAKGGRDHSSHRLVYLGLSEKRVVWISYCLATAGGVVALLLNNLQSQSLPLFGIFFLSLILAGIYLARIKVRSTPAGESRPNWTLLITNLLHKQEAATIIFDMILVVICFYAAYLLRFDFNFSGDMEKALFQSIPIVISSTLIINFLAGTYRNRWHLFSVADLPTYLISSVGATVLSIALVTVINRFETGYSRSAFIIFGLLLFLAQIGSRLSFRFFDVVLLRNGGIRNSASRKPILIYGAGKAGKLLFEEILDNSEMQNFYVMGFIDDKPELAKKILCGAIILPPGKWLSKCWQQVPEIWVSSKSITDARIKKFMGQWRGNLPIIKRLRLQMEVSAYADKSDEAEVIISMPQDHQAGLVTR
jgi:UDP-GlcNAc:undecaprenyl-phosphate GlcNAc-1-phosphate transferase